MQVKYLNLQKQFSDPQIRTLVNRILNKSNFVLGEELTDFEARFARFCGADYAIGVGSGTDALILALKARHIGPGCEVITVPNSFIATTGSIVAVGARPVFVDVQEDLNIDADKIEACITKHTRAIMPVHLTGNPCNLYEIYDIAARHNLDVIEDAAQAVDASYRGRKIGSFGTTCFSLHPLKTLNVCGDGGVVTTNDSEVYERIKLLRNHGLVDREKAIVFGYCSRLDTLQAAVASYNLSNLSKNTEKRIENAYFYSENLQDYVQVPVVNRHTRKAFHTYVIQAERRDELRMFLEQKGIETKIHYPIPIHKQRAFQRYKRITDTFPVCEKQSEKILSLPINQYLTQDELQYVVDSIKSFYTGG